MLVSAHQDRAQEILARARQAIGGAARLEAVTSLSVTGTLIRVGGWMFASPYLTTDQARIYDFTVEILLPDKYLATTRPANAFLTNDHLDGVNGDRLIARDRYRADYISPTLISSMTAERQREPVRYLLAWLLAAPASTGVQMTDGGHKAIEGQQLDCVEARGSHDLAVGLCFDAQSRLVVMTYEAPLLRSSRTATAPPPPKAAGGLFTTIQSPDESRATVVRLSDYRADDGIVFPHRMTITMAAQVREDWTIKRFKVNPKLDLNHFEPTVFDAR